MRGHRDDGLQPRSEGWHYHTLYRRCLLTDVVVVVYWISYIHIYIIYFFIYIPLILPLGFALHKFVLTLVLAPIRKFSFFLLLHNYKNKHIAPFLFIFFTNSLTHFPFNSLFFFCLLPRPSLSVLIYCPRVFSYLISSHLFDTATNAFFTDWALFASHAPESLPQQSFHNKTNST